MKAMGFIIRVSGKILRSSAVPEYIINPKVLFSFGNQALNCASTSWE